MPTTTHPQITRNGRALARKLNPAIGTTRAIEETCSLIARHARTLQGLSEYTTNGGNDRLPDDVRQRLLDEAEERTDKIEARITRLVESLPHTDDGPFGVVFQGDPRGCAVKISAPAEWEHLYDDWGREGICVDI